MSGIRVIVTGGAGFIGSSLVDSLVGKGVDVLVLDDLSRGSTQNLERAIAAGVRFELLDVRNGPAVTKEFIKFRPDYVFHMAGQIDVRLSMGDPALDASINVLGSVNVFAAARVAEVRRVVSTSSGGAIYGETSVVPTPETTPPDPISAYGLSKCTVERYARWFNRSEGLDIVTLRYGNVYGARQNPVGDAGVIAVFCQRLLSGHPITIYGDGRQTRDYVYVADIAEANFAAAITPRLRNREFNIGTGTEVSVLALAETIAAEAGIPACRLQLEFAPPRPGELLRSCLDVSRARRELKLAPSTPLAVGLAQTIAWVRARAATVDVQPR
jgi:UDP-glucose 4-epimerase